MTPRNQILGVREGSGDRMVTLDELQRRPDPVPMGRNHLPVRYDEAISRLYDSLNVMNFDVGDSQFALCRKESILLGLINIGNDTFGGLDGSRLLGLRMSEVQAVGFKLVAGVQIYVCTNLVLSGEDVLVSSKQTINANIKNAITGGLANFMISATNFEARMKQLQETSYDDVEAKSVMFDLAMTLAPNYLKDAAGAYFEVDPTADCAPRNAWGVHNAWTRSLRKTTGVNKIEHTQRLSKYFHI